MRLRVPLYTLLVALVLTPVVLATWIAVEGAKLSAPVPAIGDLFGKAVTLPQPGGSRTRDPAPDSKRKSSDYSGRAQAGYAPVLELS